MSELKDFDLKAFEKKIGDTVRKMSVFVLTDIFDGVFTGWPEDTAWSLANHRINLRNSNSFPLEPASRPDLRGVLTGQAQANAQEQIDKLKDIKPYSIQVIGNPVPYADEVGFVPGNGLFIYLEAAKSAALSAEARFGRKE